MVFVIKLVDTRKTYNEGECSMKKWYDEEYEWEIEVIG